MYALIKNRRLLCRNYTFAFCGSLVILGIAGCNGLPGIGGSATGTVTNALTGTGVAGLTVIVDPPVEGVETTTGATGAYLIALPTGIHTLTFQGDNFDLHSETVEAFGGAITVLDVAMNPVQPVVVSVAIDGDAVPSGSITATATVDVLDGSTVQWYSWTQVTNASATITGGSTSMATVSLPDRGVYKDLLFEFLGSPPIGEEELPSNVPLPEGDFPGGLQDRFQVVGLSPFALEEAAVVALEVTVTTSSGTYTGHAEVYAELPWAVSSGLANIPIGIPVLMHGKTQSAYNWAMDRPAGSASSLTDSTTQSPYFTPDVTGTYEVTITDQGVDPVEVVTLNIVAGTWEGAVTGQDEDGRPVSANCTNCHNGALASDTFTPWAQTGHAEIFTNNLDTSTHYGENCFACHTVGFDPTVDNGGMDEAADYGGFLDAGLLNNPGDNWTTVLQDFPETAQLANIQCENCHGPNNSSLHFNSALDSERISLSSDVCATCHGEPLRHARFQQWQLSSHANYSLAIDESESGSCARCHTANGFLAWLPILLDNDPATDPLDDIEVSWTSDQAHPQTCVVCHDPHAIGTTTGVNTDATVRISGDTPPLVGGFQAFGVGRGAVCMTCHNSRRGQRDDTTFAVTRSTDAARAPHGSAQSDVLMGENAYLVETGVRGSHSLVEDTCVNCHMEQTPPPDLLAYNLGGTNHTFFARNTICSNCHDEVVAESVQSAYQASADQLLVLVEDAFLTLISAQIAAGNTIDFGGEVSIATAGTIEGIAFGEHHGRQALTLSLSNGTTVGPIRLNDVDVLDATAASLGELYDFADDRLIKAGWNWNLANNDGSRGVHNPSFVFSFLDAAIDGLTALAAE